MVVSSAQSKYPLIKKLLKIGLYLFLALFLFNLLFIYLRERFGLKGCVLCVDEVKEIVEMKKNQFV